MLSRSQQGPVFKRGSFLSRSFPSSRTQKFSKNFNRPHSTLSVSVLQSWSPWFLALLITGFSAFISKFISFLHSLTTNDSPYDQPTINLPLCCLAEGADRCTYFKLYQFRCFHNFQLKTRSHSKLNRTTAIKIFCPRTIIKGKATFF